MYRVLLSARHSGARLLRRPPDQSMISMTLHLKLHGSTGGAHYKRGDWEDGIGLSGTWLRSQVG